MKKLILAISILFSVLNIFSQSNKYKYIELSASVDFLGNIKIMPLAEKIKNITDTSVNYKLINSIVAKTNNAIATINLLAEEGWFLVSVISISKGDNGRPNAPYLAYYFKKDY